MPRKLREVSGDEMGDFFQFNKLGDYVEGTYVKERVSTGGQFGPQPVFDVRTEDGRLLTVTGTFDLKSKMAKVPVGAYVHIEYVNNQDLPPNRDGTARNPMKRFRVQTDAEHDAPPKKPDDAPF